MGFVSTFLWHAMGILELLFYAFPITIAFAVWCGVVASRVKSGSRAIDPSKILWFTFPGHWIAVLIGGLVSFVPKLLRPVWPIFYEIEPFTFWIGVAILVSAIYSYSRIFPRVRT